MTTIEESAGATTTSNQFPRVEVTQATTTDTLREPSSQTAPLADPYDPARGRAAQRAFLKKREQVQAAAKTAIT